MDVSWNLWHGCHKKSEGCKNCYVYRRDESIGKDSNIIYKTKSFNLPILKNKKGEYKYKTGTSFMTCFSSDFFIEEADAWRNDALKIIKERSDCDFFLITKRPERIMKVMNPKDYPNLAIACTMENNKRINERLPIYLDIDMEYHGIMIEPMLEDINLEKYDLNKVDQISVGGESGPNSRAIDFNWVKKIHDLCKKKKIDFYFHQTGAKIIVEGKVYNIPRNKQHSQAAKAFKDRKFFECLFF